MGFGKKTDYSTGKTLDLDKTFKNIIKPAVEESGLICLRADEIQESGIIDKNMYTLLIQSDLVIADISTYNPNAIYELGIRHGVKPYATIIIKEKEGKIPFDLDHTRIFTYSHLGEDIGFDEAERCKKSLRELILNIISKVTVDSPLYEYIAGAKPVILSDEEYFEVINELAEREKHVFAIVEKALKLMEESKFLDASKTWEKASKIIPSEPYFIQQRALSLYKSKHPSEGVALAEALNIIKDLDPEFKLNDPETLGITGAIYKRMWLLHSDIEFCNLAIKYYGKGFSIRNDYYTGVNYAICLNMKGNVETNEDEKIYCRIEATKSRKKIVESLLNEIESIEFEKREDKRWVFAALAECYLGLGENGLAELWEEKFFACPVLDWEKDTYVQSKIILTQLLK